MFRILWKKRVGFAAEMLGSLIGLYPRQETRMAVFVAAGDESERGDQTGPFIFGGYVAPVADWLNWFAPAWEERVLNGPPTIPFFHMAEIRSPNWQAKNGLTTREAERRINEAVRVVHSMGSLHFVKSEIDGDRFRGFSGFAYGALEYVATTYPQAEHVQFVIERKEGVTHHLSDFDIAEGLRRKGENHLVRLIGDVIPTGKNYVPLQAVDLALWHWRRYLSGVPTAADRRRIGRLFNMVPMMVNGLTNEQITAMGERSKANQVPGPFTSKRKRVAS